MRRFLASLTVLMFSMTLLVPAAADSATLEELRPQIKEEMHEIFMNDRTGGDLSRLRFLGHRHSAGALGSGLSARFSGE